MEGGMTPAALALAAVAAALLTLVLVRRLLKERAWTRRLSAELAAQAAFTDGLVASLGAVSGTLDAARIVERIADEAHALVGPDATLVLVPSPGSHGLRPITSRGLAFAPLADLAVTPAPESPIARAMTSRRPVAASDPGDADDLCARLRPAAVMAVPVIPLGEVEAVIVLLRLSPGASFAPYELSQASLFADFSARAAEPARLFERVESLLSEARVREA